MDLPLFIERVQLLTSCIVALTGLVVAVGAFFSPVRKWIASQFGQNPRLIEMDKKINEISAFTGSLAHLNEKFKHDSEERELMKQGILATLRNDLTAIWNKADERGYIGDWDRENFERMVKVYFDMGGNAYMHAVNEKIMKLPRVPAAKRPARARRVSTKRTGNKLTKNL